MNRIFNYFFSAKGFLLTPTRWWGGGKSPIPKPVTQQRCGYTTTRVDYIDLLKGITILWIIWMHTYHPDFGNLRNPIFFFASGIFFKISDAKTFFLKRILLILIPFTFFYLMSVPIKWIIDYWDYRDIFAFDWSRILDIFRCEAKADYLSLNRPLWFLITLFLIQSFSFIIMRLPKIIIATFALVSLIFFEDISSQPSYFMVNCACAWFCYFAFGYLIGKHMIAFINNSTRKIAVFVISISLFLLLQFVVADIAVPFHLTEKTKSLSFIIGFMTFFSFFNGFPQLEILRFFGKNSLIVLGAHMWILVPLERLFHKLFHMHNYYIGFAIATLTAMFLIPIIIYMNKYIPNLVGKR